MGKNLAAALNRAIASKIGASTNRADIIQKMASSAKISPNTVTNILSGDINCPPENRINAFARTLGVSSAALKAAMGRDGCSTNDGGLKDIFMEEIKENAEMIKENIKKMEDAI